MKKLGRGLSELGLNELLSGTNQFVAAPLPPLNASIEKEEKILYLPVDKVVPSEYQPRKQIDSTTLSELSDSIKAQGILQPIIVRPRQDDSYEIVAGERRWRAAQLAGLDKIPAISRNISNQTTVAFALIENVQRKDLNAMEEAQALQRLLEEFGLTHQEVATAIGKSRTAVSNLLRLLQLNKKVKDLLMVGKLEMGHARALLAVTGPLQDELAQQVVAKGLSVRETEALVNRHSVPKSNFSKLREKADPNTMQWQNQLAQKLGAKVEINHNSQGKGKLVIQYLNLEALAEILAFFSIE